MAGIITLFIIWLSVMLLLVYILIVHGIFIEYIVADEYNMRELAENNYSKNQQNVAKRYDHKDDKSKGLLYYYLRKNHLSTTSYTDDLELTQPYSNTYQKSILHKKHHHSRNYPLQKTLKDKPIIRGDSVVNNLTDADYGGPLQTKQKIINIIASESVVYPENTQNRSLFSFPKYSKMHKIKRYANNNPNFNNQNSEFVEDSIQNDSFESDASSKLSKDDLLVQKISNTEMIIQSKSDVFDLIQKLLSEDFQPGVIRLLNNAAKRNNSNKAVKPNDSNNVAKHSDSNNAAKHNISNNLIKTSETLSHKTQEFTKVIEQTLSEPKNKNHIPVLKNNKKHLTSTHKSIYNKPLNNDRFLKFGKSSEKSARLNNPDINQVIAEKLKKKWKEVLDSGDYVIVPVKNLQENFAKSFDEKPSKSNRIENDNVEETGAKNTIPFQENILQRYPNFPFNPNKQQVDFYSRGQNELIPETNRFSSDFSSAIDPNIFSSNTPLADFYGNGKKETQFKSYMNRFYPHFQSVSSEYLPKLDLPKDNDPLIERRYPGSYLDLLAQQGLIPGYGRSSLLMLPPSKTEATTPEEELDTLYPPWETNKIDYNLQNPPFMPVTEEKYELDEENIDMRYKPAHRPRKPKIHYKKIQFPSDFVEFVTDPEIDPEANSFRKKKSITRQKREVNLKSLSNSIINDASIDECNCTNGGTCTVSHVINGNRILECTCVPKFTGQFCESGLDLCGGKCKEHEICTDNLNCTCINGYVKEGDDCIPSITCEEFPCLNGAECVDKTDDSFECLCALGYLGKLCEIRVPECEDSSCSTKEMCISTEVGYKCILKEDIEIT